MKTKLHALIAEQKALTARFEELLNETDDKPIAYCRTCMYFADSDCLAFISDREHYDNCMNVVHESDFKKCKPKRKDDE